MNKAAPLRILVADDEPHITYMICRKLEAAGFCAVSADNGQKAFSLALEQRPALIITDYQMPVQSGFEMCLQLRDHACMRSTPVIMLTARGHRLSDEDIKRAGIHVLLQKPFSMLEIIDHVKRLLGQTACNQRHGGALAA